MKNAIDEMREESLKIGEERGIKLGEERGLKLGEERGLKLGEERGREAGEKLGICKSITALMESEGWSFERTITSLGIPEADIVYYRKLLEEK